MQKLAALSLMRRTALAVLSVTFAINASTALADELADAQAVTKAFFGTTDRSDPEAAYQLAGELLRRAAPKRETLAGLQKWFDAKGGAASSRELVVQRTMSAEEARAAFPGVPVQGSVYAFRYRSKYPKGVFFEDLYVSRDSDKVLRINGHLPQPAE
jgi:hypothetical protein